MFFDKRFIHQFSFRVIQASATWDELQHNGVSAYLVKVEGIKPTKDRSEIIYGTFVMVLLRIKL